MANQQSKNIVKREIDTLTVNESWKKRFRFIEKYYNNNENFWKHFQLKEEYRQLSRKEIFSINNEITFKNGGIGTYIAATFFGPFYYLVKGMWLKAIVYTIFMIVLLNILAFLMHVPDDYPLGRGTAIIWGFLAAQDYYRLKVLGKQW